MQTRGISSDVKKSEIHTTQSFLQDFRQNGYNTAMVSAREIAENVALQGWRNFCKSEAAFQITDNQLGRNLKQQYT